MFFSILALVLGFMGLILAADKFSDNGAKLGVIFKVSPIIIGLVVFGFGTSAPEILVSAFAASSGNNDIGIGNAIGSNIFNITLVLAISALISIVPFTKQTLKKEYLFLLGLTFIVGILLMDNYLSRIDGFILLIVFIAFLALVFKTAKNDLLEEIPQIGNDSKSKVWSILILSLIVLLASSKAVVYGATNIAQYLGVSELVIGLTIVSLGTSLPELSLAIASALKKQHQMLIGNILGSNIFNSTAVLMVVAFINPDKIDVNIFSRDYVFALIATLLIFALAYKKSGNHQINKFGGIALLSLLGYYLFTLI